MATDFAPLKNFLLELGMQEVRHPSESSFYQHSLGVSKYFERLGSPEYMVRAGLFHSIYGAQGFEDFALPISRRAEIAGLIGADAEQVVYLYCAASDESLQDSFEGDATPRLWDRFLKCPLPVTEEEFTGLLWLTLIDVLEQDARWVRKDPANVGAIWAPFLRKVSERLGPAAVAEWDRVYGRLQVARQFG
ncbi:MAG TPA: hypothetical protein VN228_15615 [Pyrinomonadaceae bacterium]|nr:hypothetical protein [Pyrinomonadaceae bacterium]